MIQKCLTVILSLLLLTGCIVEKSSKLEPRPEVRKEKQLPKEEFIPKSIKLLAIGDSLTKGVGDETGRGGYVGVVEENLEQHEDIKEVSVINYGVRGQKTNNLQKKLQDESVIASIKEADIIVMTIGGNDIMKVVRNNIFALDFAPFRREQVNYESRLRDIFTTIQEYNQSVQIVYVGLYNPFKYMLPDLPEIDTIIDEWNLATKGIINEYENIVFVEVDHIFSTKEDVNLLYKDEFHPNEIGYSFIGEIVYHRIIQEKLYRETKLEMSDKNE